MLGKFAGHFDFSLVSPRDGSEGILRATLGVGKNRGGNAKIVTALVLIMKITPLILSLALVVWVDFGIAVESIQPWIHYRSKTCPFEADFPSEVYARVIQIAGKEYASEHASLSGGNSLLVRCTVIQVDPRELSDAALLGIGGWDINDKNIKLQRLAINGVNVLRLARSVDPIRLHRIFFAVGKYHYRADFNEREPATAEIERFFNSIVVTNPATTEAVGSHIGRNINLL
jgi:hypothetical protein